MTTRFWKSSHNIKLKICGVQDLGFAYDCYELGVDALGFHIWTRDIKANRTEKLLSLFNQITNALPNDISNILLIDFDGLSLMKKALARCRFDAIQLHFDFSHKPSMPQAIRDINNSVKVIGVVSMNSAESSMDPHMLTYKYSKTCDAVLLDTSWRGGSGKTHDWDVAAKICKDITSPIILAGG